MMTRPRQQLLFLCLLQYVRVSTSRTWEDAIDPTKLQNDGMPRVAPPRDKAKDYASVAASASNAMSHMIAQHIEIEMHGSTTTLFEETDPFRVTAEPSAAPSYSPSSVPSDGPSAGPTGSPSDSPTESFPPTGYPTSSPTTRPTASPTFSVAAVPRNPGKGYFNYDGGGSHGPDEWKNVDEIEEGDPGYFWHTFDLDDSGDVSNDCGSGKKQSPVDICTKPRESCTETHEMRPKSGDYKMDSEFITKQILSNKLRLVMAPRTGEEPDPPQIDFSSNGRGIIDMTNIDFKFPSEHTVCGQRFDGEMQYFTYHPARKRFVAVSFFLDASETNSRNEHLQEVIDAFKIVHEEDERKCKERQERQSSSGTSANSFAGSFASGSSGKTTDNSFASSFASDGGGKTSDNSFARSFASGGGGKTSDNSFASSFASGGSGRTLRDKNHEQEQYDRMWNATTTKVPEDNRGGGGPRSKRRRLALKWHPFHPDVQKTVHFWGYSGSFTDPPCTRDSVDWKVMDVPTPISPRQLAQLRHVLFAHVDERCRRTSVHNSEGSVARPTQEPARYYKCTRDDYVSDEERAVCGDEGCVVPFGSGLERYYPPLVKVTGPPTRSPSK